MKNESYRIDYETIYQWKCSLLTINNYLSTDRPYEAGVEMGSLQFLVAEALRELGKNAEIKDVE